ncbi:MAG: DUF4062 domain-containing protein [Isosphaerales bacterium]
MSEVPCVFISATTRDLGSCRTAVRDVLLTLNAFPVLQDHFAPEAVYRTVVEMLRARIKSCDAVICLVGRVYGEEPRTRSENQPRRSYTQLEYEIAVEPREPPMPVFVFIATNDCPADHPDDPPEDDELRCLQLEHLKRLQGSDRSWMPFRSREDLIAQVGRMRFDPEPPPPGVTTCLAVLMTVELVDSDSFRVRRGEVAWARDVLKPYHDRFRAVRDRWKGTVQWESLAECQVNFESAHAAVSAALELHHALRHHAWADSAPGLRIGIDMGQVVRFGGVDDAHIMQAGQVLTASRRLAQLGRPGQTLLSRAAFDSARQHVRQLLFPGEATASELGWETYGRYIISGSDEPLDVCEVGVKGEAPLAAPGDSDQVQRADSVEERRMRDWRPCIKQEIPRRRGWFIERKLGEGGFGEVWIARHEKTRELRVFKFCFDAARLTSFKRELTLFRLLRDALGNRQDIARLLEVKLDQAPFYLESEYVEGGNLREWSEAGNRLAGLPLDERLRVMAAIARAVAAAHSVGIIHKDLKPSNIFMRLGSGESWQPVLADFGIGAVADRSLLVKRDITDAGFTPSLPEPGSSRAGTGMYQPPEASLDRVATVQGDVYALGVMLFQIIVGDFDQPLAVGWEQRLEGARARGFGGGSGSPEPGIADPGGTAPGSEPVAGTKPPPPPARDPRDDVVMQLLKEDINDCVIGDPAQRLASVAQLAERLDTLDARVAARLASRRAERAVLRMRRLRALLGASLVLLVVVGGLAAFAFAMYRTAKKQEWIATNEAQEKGKALGQARAEKKKADEQTDLARRTAYNLTLAQVDQLWLRDPASALDLLRDREICRAEFRDFTWNYYFRICQAERYPRVGHTSVALSVAFSPDGKTLVSGGVDGTPRLWDPDTGNSFDLLKEEGANGAVQSVAFSPDSKTLVGGGDDGRLRLWDVDRHKQTRLLQGHWDPKARFVQVLSVSLSRDGQTLASAGADGTVRLWNVKTPEEPPRLLLGHTGGVNAVAFSPVDDQTLASAGADGTVRMWDVETGKQIPPSKIHTDAVNGVAFSPDGQTLASGDADGTVRLWDVKTGDELHQLAGDLDAVNSVAFSPDNQTLATGGADGSVRMWNATTGKERALLTGHTAPVNSVAFSRDRKTLASAGVDGTVRLWNVVTGQDRRKPFKVPINPISDPVPEKVLSGHVSAVRCVSFGAGGKTLATGAAGGIIRLWDVLSGEVLRTLKDGTGRIRSLSFHRNGTMLASGGDDGAVRLWDTVSGKKRHQLDGHASRVRCVSFASDGRTLASGGDDGNVCLWDVNTGNKLWESKGRMGGAVAAAVFALAFSPDSKTLATGDADGTVRLWDVESGKERHTLKKHIGRVRAVTFSPDGKTLASGGDDLVVRLWDPATNKLQHELNGHTGWIRAVAFSPDGKTLASAGIWAVRLWDPVTGQQRAALRGHTSALNCVAFSPNSLMLASGSWDKTVRIWKADRSAPP